MTVMVAEKTGQAAASRAASRKVAQGRVTSSTYDTYNTRTRRRPSAQPSAPAAPAAQKPGSANGPIGSQRIQTGAPSIKLVPGDRRYQPVILAEFLAAVVIIALVPMATGGSDTAKAKGSMSPYDTTDLTQLVAAGAVYFVLALASSGNSGRLSAWLGGLILIAIAMGKLAHGNLSAVFNFAKPGGGVAQYGKTADPFATGDTGQ